MATTAESYAALCEALSRAGVVGDSAEVHGGLCAGLCTNGIAGATAWSEEWLADVAAPRGEVAELRARLREIGLGSWHALCDADFAFELLLPADDAPQSVRLRALASWCHGFVEGIGLGGLDRTTLSRENGDDLSEIITDFVEISHAELDEPASSATDFQLIELIEFVRVGAQTVFEILTEGREHRAHKTLH